MFRNKAAEGHLGWVIDPLSLKFVLRSCSNNSFNSSEYHLNQCYWEKGGSNIPPQTPSAALFQHMVLTYKKQTSDPSNQLD